MADGLDSSSLKAFVPDDLFARGCPKKGKRRRKPRLVSLATSVSLGAVDGRGPSSSAIMRLARCCDTIEGYAYEI